MRSTASSRENGKQQRAAARGRANAGAHPGFLRRSRAGAGAQYNYRAALADLDLWSRQRSLCLSTSADWDKHLAAYMEFLFLKGDQPWVGRDALYGAAWAHDLPIEGRSDFILAKRSLKGWEKRCPGDTGKPIPFDQLFLVSNHMFVNNGIVGLEAACANFIAFDCYLRPPECLDLRTQHLTRPRPSSNLPWVVTTKPRDEGTPAKNQEFDCSTTIGGPRRAFVNDIAAALHRNTKDGNLLFPNLTLTLWEKLFRDACKSLHIVKPQFTPRSLRHGGPSTDKLNGDLDDNEVLRRGRWRSLDSVRRYGKTGVLAKLLAAMPDGHLAVARDLRLYLVPSLNNALDEKKRAARRLTGKRSIIDTSDAITLPVTRRVRGKRPQGALTD